MTGAPEWIVAGVGVAVTLAVWGSYLLWASKRPQRQAQVRSIRVNGRYRPSRVHVRAGAPTLLIFHREESARCSERVVFPDFGISVALPEFETVTISLPPGEPGEHEFTCQMGMLHGMLVVDEDEER